MVCRTAVIPRGRAMCKRLIARRLGPSEGFREFKTSRGNLPRGNTPPLNGQSSGSFTAGQGAGHGRLEPRIPRARSTSARGPALVSARISSRRPSSRGPSWRTPSWWTPSSRSSFSSSSSSTTRPYGGSGPHSRGCRTLPKTSSSRPSCRRRTPAVETRNRGDPSRG